MDARHIMAYICIVVLACVFSVWIILVAFMRA